MLSRDSGPLDERSNDWRIVKYALGLGFFMAISIVLGFFAGFALDKLLGTRPIFCIVFAFLAVAGSFYKAYRDVMKMC